MSYTISLFTINTKQKEQELDQPDFFEKEENLEKFTPDQQAQLEDRLLKYRYVNVNIKMYKKWKIKMYNLGSTIHQLSYHQ